MTKEQSEKNKSTETVPFEASAVLAYLDVSITFWRSQTHYPSHIYYVDAYQSVRMSLFGELLPATVEETK